MDADGMKTKKLKTSHQEGENPTEIQLQLRIGGTTLSVDKDALIEGSPYFAAMLGRNFQESDSSSIELRQPENVHLETLVKLVKHLSSGRHIYHLPIERKDALKMWIAAKYLQMDEAVAKAETILREIMALPENVYRLWRLARRDKLPDVERLAFEGILQQLPRRSEFANSEMFLQSTVEEVTDILTHEAYTPQSETAVYQAVVRWYMHVETERKQHLQQLLDRCVVWGSIDIEALITSSSTTGPLHEELTQILDDRRIGLTGGGALLKRAIPKDTIFYHMREGHPHLLLRFDFTRNELTKLDSPLQATLAKCWWKIKASGFAVAVGRELIVGTTDADKNTDTEPDTDKNEMIAMDCTNGATRTLMVNSPFNGCICVVAVGSEVYGAAGNHPFNWYCLDVASGRIHRASQLPLHSFEKYTMTSHYNRASMEAYPLPHGRIWFQSVGSYFRKHDHHTVSMVEMYDIHTNKWRELTQWMDEGRFHHRCGTVVFQGDLYYTGGCVDTKDPHDWEENGKAVTACYRVPLDRSWEHERIADLNVARYNHCVFIKDGQIWVYGGTTHVGGNNQRKRALTSFEAYNIEDNEWKVVEVAMSKELQTEVAGGNFAQKTVCLPLQYHTPKVCDGRECQRRYEGDEYEYYYGESDDPDDPPYTGRSTWPAGLDE